MRNPAKTLSLKPENQPSQPERTKRDQFLMPPTHPTDAPKRSRNLKQKKARYLTLRCGRRGLRWLRRRRRRCPRIWRATSRPTPLTALISPSTPPLRQSHHRGAKEQKRRRRNKRETTRRRDRSGKQTAKKVTRRKYKSFSFSFIDLDHRALTLVFSPFFPWRFDGEEGEISWVPY